jgi:hypothetical protein
MVYKSNFVTERIDFVIAGNSIVSTPEDIMRISICRNEKPFRTSGKTVSDRSVKFIKPWLHVEDGLIVYWQSSTQEFAEAVLNPLGWITTTVTRRGETRPDRTGNSGCPSIFAFQQVSVNVMIKNRRNSRERAAKQ